MTAQKISSLTCTVRYCTGNITRSTLHIKHELVEFITSNHLKLVFQELANHQLQVFLMTKFSEKQVSVLLNCNEELEQAISCLVQEFKQKY